MNTFLIGYRATGKSSVGRALAMKMNAPFVDSDDEIERRAGKSITAIFSEDGEPAFRDLEAAVVSDLAANCPGVVSLGGGAILREESRRAIADGFVIWLQASPETIARRVALDAASAQRRPPLTTHADDDEIRLVLAQREPLYAACADVAIETENKATAQVVDEVFAVLLENQG